MRLRTLSGKTSVFLPSAMVKITCILQLQILMSDKQVILDLASNNKVVRWNIMKVARKAHQQWQGRQELYGRDSSYSRDASKSREARKAGTSTPAGMIAGRDADGISNIRRCKDVSNSKRASPWAAAVKEASDSRSTSESATSYSNQIIANKDGSTIEGVKYNKGEGNRKDFNRGGKWLQ